MDFYSRNKQEAIDEFSTSVSGLSQVEAQKRLEEHGKNELAQGKKKRIQ